MLICVDFCGVYILFCLSALVIMHLSMLSPTPQYGDGWGITKRFEAKFGPQGGAFELMELWCYSACSIRL